MSTAPTAKPSIRDIADSAGVSPATVSRVLNNRAGEVGPETRARVLNTIRRMNYRPQQGPRAAADVLDTFTLGIVSGMHSRHLLAPGYHKSLIEAIFAASDKYRQNLLLYAGHLFHSDLHQSIRTYCDGRCEGMFMVVGEMNNLLGRTLRERGIPLVIIGDTGDDNTVAFCSVDNVASSREATEYLIRQGHRRIAICRGPAHLRSAHQRYQGYVQALAANGIAADAELESPFFGTEHEVSGWVEWLIRLALYERPTAIVCFNDLFAVAIRAALAETGLRVPLDISLTGFDDVLPNDSAAWLTTVRQPYSEIGMRSVEALIAQIRGDQGVAQRTILPGDLIVRGSVAPPVT